MVPNYMFSFSLAPLSCSPNSIKIHAAYRYGEAEAKYPSDGLPQFLR